LVCGLGDGDATCKKADPGHGVLAVPT